MSRGRAGAAGRAFGTTQVVPTQISPSAQGGAQTEGADKSGSAATARARAERSQRDNEQPDRVVAASEQHGGGQPEEAGEIAPVADVQYSFPMESL